MSDRDNGETPSIKRQREYNRLWMAAYTERHRDEINARSREAYAKDRARRQAQNRAWYAAHREEMKQRRRANAAQMRDRKSAWFKKYYAANADKRKAASRAYYEEHRAAVRARDNAYRAAHPDKTKARARAKYLANPEEYHLRAAKRRAMKKTTRIGRVNFKLLRDQFDGVCGICRQALDLKADKYHYDHIVPLAAGGTHEMANLQIAHARCNLKKGARAA